MSRSLAGKLGITNAIPSAVQAVTVTQSAGVDLANWGSACIVFNANTVTDGTHTPSVLESDTLGSGYTAVAAGNLSAALVAITTGSIQKVDYKGTKRYIKAKVTVTGSPATGGDYGALIITSRPASIAVGS